jgi:hypothetical protein
MSTVAVMHGTNQWSLSLEFIITYWIGPDFDNS